MKELGHLAWGSQDLTPARRAGGSAVSILHGLAIGIALVPSVLEAQIIVGEPVSCPDCQIVIDTVVTLGATDGPGAMAGPPWRGGVDKLGRFILLQPNSGDLPFVFASDGRFLQRIGGLGEGPNEYLRVTSVETGGAHTHVWDSGVGRLTTLSDSFEELSTIQPGGRVFGSLHLSSGQTVLNMARFDDSHMGYALHLVTPEGLPIKAFDEHAVIPGNLAALQRHLLVAPDGFWALNGINGYRLVRYAPNGELVTEYLRPSDRDLYAPFTYGDPKTGTPPSMMVVGAWLDDGLIWTLSNVPSDEWKDALGSEPDAHEGYPITSTSILLDAVIEAFDPDSAQFLARLVIDRSYPDVVLGHGYIGKIRTHDLGWAFLDVLKVRLVRPK